MSGTPPPREQQSPADPAPSAQQTPVAADPGGTPHFSSLPPLPTLPLPLGYEPSVGARKGPEKGPEKGTASILFGTVFAPD